MGESLPAPIKDAVHDLPKRVLIVGDDHPWKGHEGEVVGVTDRKAAGLALRVRLDRGEFPGQEVYVSAGEWRKAPGKDAT